MSIKKSRNIYEGYEFHEYPYDSNEKFSIYLPKEKESVIDQLSRSRVQFEKSPIPQILSRKSRSLSKQRNEENAFIQNIQKDEKNSQLKLPKLANGDEGKKFINTDEVSISKEIPNTYIRKSKSLGRINKSDEISSSPKKETKKNTIVYLKERKELDDFKAKIYYDIRTHSVPKNCTKSRIIENLIKERENILHHKDLFKSILKLKEINLLKTPKVKVETFKTGRMNYITNDYHLRETNPGYARNTLGTFFTR